MRIGGRGTGKRTARGAAVRWGMAACAAALLATLGGCESIFGPGDDPGPVEVAELPRSLTADERAVRDASNRFGFDLLGRILDDAPDETHFLSPLSASMALGMTLNGADGETFDAMRETLRLGDRSEEAVNDSYRGLVDLLRTLDPAVSVRLANAVWHRDGIVPREAFVSRVEEHFDAAVEGLDFQDPGAADVINGWVDEATNGRIDEMVRSPIRGDLVAFLLNAVHFEAGWTEPFDRDQTGTAPFRTADGEEVPVELMHRADDSLAYHGTSTYDAVELPYGGGAFAMTVVVPRDDHGPADVVAGLAGGGWDELLDGLSERRAQVYLPRFELEWERTLNDDLSALGMEVAFGPAADFGRMFENASPWIDEVRQKSFVRVDEEGTEAAAVTQVTMVESLPPTVRADRPFLFVIHERLSGTVLFVGAVLEAPPAPS